MKTVTCNPLPPSPQDWATGAFDQVKSANAGGSITRADAMAKNLANEDQSVGGPGNEQSDRERAADPPVGSRPPTHDGSNPTGAMPVESPVVQKHDHQILTGEGDIQMENDSLEGGDTPGAGDGGDAGGQAVGMDTVDSVDKMDIGKKIGDAAMEHLATAKNYQAAGPDSPYPDSRPDAGAEVSSDPLAYAVGSLQDAANQFAATMPDSFPGTALRDPTAVSPEIGGHETGDAGPDSAG